MKIFPVSRTVYLIMQSNQVALIEPRPVSYTEAEMHKTHVNLLGKSKLFYLV